MNSVHLTDEQIDDFLIGDLADECTSHLDGCALCQSRVAELQSPISSFNNVTLAWTERKSATMPVRPAAFASGAPHGHRALWTATAVAAVAFGVAIPVNRHHTRLANEAMEHATSAPAQTFGAEREQQIAQDNQMLLAIDRELDSKVSSPSETFGLEAAADAHRGSRSASVRD